jgi:hypothetical protein
VIRAYFGVDPFNLAPETPLGNLSCRGIGDWRAR